MQQKQIDTLAPPVPKTNFLRNVGYHFKCTICLDVLQDPVSLQCGHNFCRECVKRSVENAPVCPLCKQRCDLRTMVDDSVVSKLVQLAEEVAEEYGVDDIMESQLEVADTQVPLDQHPPLQTLGSSGSDPHGSGPSPSSSRAAPAASQSRLAGALLQLTKQESLHPEADMLSASRRAPSGAPFPALTVEAQPRFKSVVSNFMSLTQGMQLAKTQVVDDASFDALDTQQSGVSPWRLHGRPPSQMRQPSSGGEPDAANHSRPSEDRQSSLTPGGKRRREESDGLLSGPPAVSEHSRTSDDSDEESQQSEDRPGTTLCHLCQLDTKNRKLMRGYLRYIILNDATCVQEDIQAIDQTQIDTMLGAMCGPYQVCLPEGDGADEMEKVYAHYLCVLWSSEVFVTRGELRNAQDAIVRSESQHCAFCDAAGATVGCSHDDCEKSFHVPCAFLTGNGVCGVVESCYAVYCPEHYNAREC